MYLNGNFIVNLTIRINELMIDIEKKIYTCLVDNEEKNNWLCHFLFTHEAIFFCFFIGFGTC